MLSIEYTTVVAENRWAGARDYYFGEKFSLFSMCPDDLYRVFGSRCIRSERVVGRNSVLTTIFVVISAPTSIKISSLNAFDLHKYIKYIYIHTHTNKFTRFIVPESAGKPKRTYIYNAYEENKSKDFNHDPRKFAENVSFIKNLFNSISYDRRNFLGA